MTDHPGNCIGGHSGIDPNTARRRYALDRLHPVDRQAAYSAAADAADAWNNLTPDQRVDRAYEVAVTEGFIRLRDEG